VLYRNGTDGGGSPLLYFYADPGPALSGSVSIPAGSAFVLDPLPFRTWTAIFEIAQNIANKDIPTWRQDILACVAALRVAEPRYLVIGGSLFADSLPPSAGSSTGTSAQPVGSPVYNQLMALHREMRALCGDRFFDVYEYAITRAMDDAISLGLLSGYTSGDNTDLANGYPPRSLRWDELHWNTTMHQLIARQLKLRINLLGW
jgi:hypothetical protein